MDTMYDVLDKVAWEKDFVDMNMPILPISGWMGGNSLMQSDTCCAGRVGVFARTHGVPRGHHVRVVLARCAMCLLVLCAHSSQVGRVEQCSATPGKGFIDKNTQVFPLSGWMRPVRKWKSGHCSTCLPGSGSFLSVLVVWVSLVVYRNLGFIWETTSCFFSGLSYQQSLVRFLGAA